MWPNWGVIRRRGLTYRLTKRIQATYLRQPEPITGPASWRPFPCNLREHHSLLTSPVLTSPHFTSPLTLSAVSPSSSKSSSQNGTPTFPDHSQHLLKEAAGKDLVGIVRHSKTAFLGVWVRLSAVFPICTRPMLRTPYILGSVGRRHPKGPGTERLPIACHAGLKSISARHISDTADVRAVWVRYGCALPMSSYHSPYQPRPCISIRKPTLNVKDTGLQGKSQPIPSTDELISSCRRSMIRSYYGDTDPSRPISLPATIAPSPPLRQSRQLHHVLALYPEFYRTSLIPHKPLIYDSDVLSSTLLIGIPPKFIPKLGGRSYSFKYQFSRKPHQPERKPATGDLHPCSSHAFFSPPAVPTRQAREWIGFSRFTELPLPVFPHALRKTHLNPQDTEALDVLPATYFAQRLIHFMYHMSQPLFTAITCWPQRNRTVALRGTSLGTVSVPFFSRAQQYPILFSEPATYPVIISVMHISLSQRGVWSGFPYMEKFCSPSPFGTAFNAPSYRIKRLKDLSGSTCVSTPDLGAGQLPSFERMASSPRIADELFPERRNTAGYTWPCILSQLTENPVHRVLDRREPSRFMEFTIATTVYVTGRDLVHSPTAGCSIAVSKVGISYTTKKRMGSLLIENSAAGYLPHIILVSRKINFPIINNNILCTTTIHPPKCPLSSRPMTTRNPKERPDNGDSNSFNKRQLMLIGGKIIIVRNQQSTGAELTTASQSFLAYRSTSSLGRGGRGETTIWESFFPTINECRIGRAN
ncbi:hypothetical protein CCUS01_12560 [Colletotrichum cuscutae]|uniref:Uncharacterized protein n=1 Tax=Colletotrichum cuscutae TaxID=1209917 RepID=A0AAI9TU14_9PEZI|nr:hypothetical protein CCUS01_12560 [Colletotrichum cuscutae]